MEKKVLFYWISTILMLNVRGQSVIDEDKEAYSKLCENCVSVVYPDCANLDLKVYNKTIYCEQADERDSCTFGIVQPSPESSDQDIICRISGAETIPTTSTPWTTLKPIPLALQKTTVQYEKIPVNNEISKIGVHSMEELNMEPTTEAPKTTIIPEPHSEEANAMNAPEVPVESADYQGDASEGDSHVAEATAAPAIVTTKAPETSVESEPNENSQNAEAEKETEKVETTTTMSNLNPENNLIHETSTAANVPAVPDESEVSVPKESGPVMPPVASDNTNLLQKCYGCESTTDTNCREAPTKEINCHAENKAKNGCYAVLKVDTNTTTRGCLSELTQEGLNYCKKHTKQCVLCHEPICNKQALSSAADLHCRLVLTAICLVLAIVIGREN